MEEQISDEFKKFCDLYLSLSKYLINLDIFQTGKISQILPYIQAAFSRVRYLIDYLSLMNPEKPALSPQINEKNETRENWRQYIQISQKLLEMNEKNPNNLTKAWNEFSESKSLLAELVKQLEATKDRTGLYPGDLGYVQPINS